MRKERGALYLELPSQPALIVSLVCLRLQLYENSVLTEL